MKAETTYGTLFQSYMSSTAVINSRVFKLVNITNISHTDLQEVVILPVYYHEMQIMKHKKKHFPYLTNNSTETFELFNPLSME
jgi:hypothetical protein